MAKQTDQPWLRFAQAAAERMTRKVQVQEFVVKGGFTLCDLQEEIRAEALKIPVLCVLPTGSSCYYPPTPWCVNIIFPSDEKKGDGLQAIICSACGVLYAIGLSIKDRKVTLTGEPRAVEHLDEYEYIDEMAAEERAKHATSHRVKGRLYRYCQVRADDVDAKSGTIQIAFSSESPGVQVATTRLAKMTGLKRGTEFIEILSHAKGDADFSALNNSGPFLDEHDTAMHIGSIKRAALSKDKKGRAAVKLDQVTDLSKTRLAQMRNGSRPHVSVGYDLVKLVRTEKQGDQTAYVFAWAAQEISSVATPMDGTVGANRGLLDSEDDPAAHCLDCGDEFERDDLDTEYRCAGCRDHKPELVRSAAGVDLSQTERKVMAETATLTEAEVTARVTAATTTARKTAIQELQARNKELHDLTDGPDGFVKRFGNYSKGKMADTIRALCGEYVAKDDSVDSTALVREFKAKANDAINKGEMPKPYSLRAKLRSQSGDVSDDDELPPDYTRYNTGRAIRSIVLRYQKGTNVTPAVDGFEKEVDQDMQDEWKRNGLSQSGDLAGGFHVPWDAPARGFRPSTRRDHALVSRFKRDMYTGDFASGGALVPSVPILPTIELLRNRMVLGWAGCKSIAGLSGNIWIPRQTSPSQPSAVSEIQQLASTQQTFDQIEGRPRRVGNTQRYSRLLMLQSAPDIEALIRDDNFLQIALKIDYLGLNGSGAGNEPLGVMNTPGIGVIVFGGTATLGEIISFETTIRQENVYDEIVFLSTSSSRGRLMYVPANLLGATVVSGQTNAIWVVNGGEETIIGRPAFDSQQIPNNQMLAGSFMHLLHLQWGGLQVIVDPYTFSDFDEVRITYNTYNDFAVRHPQAFCVSADAANQ